MDALTLIGISLLVILIYHVKNFLWRPRLERFLHSLPHPPTLPFIGNAWDFKDASEMAEVLQVKWPNTYGPRFAFRVGPDRYYFTSLDPGDIEGNKILSSSTHIFKGLEYAFVNDWLGDGLLLGGGAKWARHRKMLTPSFHFKILEDFMEVIDRQARIFATCLQEDAVGGNEVLEVCRYVTLCALDIICETSMGTSVNAQLDKDSKYVKAVNEVTASIMYRASRPWLHSTVIWRWTALGKEERRNIQILHDFTKRVIQKRKANMKKTPVPVSVVEEKSQEESDVFLSKKKKPAALMDLMLQIQQNNPEEISDAEIREEIDTFMLAGHDTTANSISWTIYLLGRHPDVQEKVAQELEEIFGDDRDRPVSSSDLSRMKYLECCIKESLRMFPSVPFIARSLKEDLKIDDRLTLPKGCSFALFPPAIHRNPVIFPDPEVFRPERFFPENSQGRHPYAYIPFSAGPRNCIGQKFAMMEEKIVIAHLLLKFKVVSLDPLESITRLMHLVYKPKDGLRVKLFLRG